LILGIGATGVSSSIVLVTGIAGLLAGALSMGAGEYVSVRSQRELLEASRPGAVAETALPHLDLEANELTLVYRARGMSIEDATAHADEVLATLHAQTDSVAAQAPFGAAPLSAASADAADAALASGEHGATDEHEAIGTGLSAAVSSFCFFASGAIIPVLPYLFGLHGLAAIVVAAVLVGLSLLGTGAVVGLLSGAPPLRRAVRQLLIGYGAAAVTYALGYVFGTEVH